MEILVQQKFRDQVEKSLHDKDQDERQRNRKKTEENWATEIQETEKEVQFKNFKCHKAVQ